MFNVRGSMFEVLSLRFDVLCLRLEGDKVYRGKF